MQKQKPSSEMSNLFAVLPWNNKDYNILLCNCMHTSLPVSLMIFIYWIFHFLPSTVKNSLFKNYVTCLYTLTHRHTLWPEWSFVVDTYDRLIYVNSLLCFTCLSRMSHLVATVCPMYDIFYVYQSNIFGMCLFWVFLFWTILSLILNFFLHQYVLFFSLR